MDAGKVVKITKLTAEEAEAFRERVRRQREEMANWVVIPIDEAIEELEELIERNGRKK